MRADPAASACGMRVKAIEGALPRRHAWHSNAGTMPSARLRLSSARGEFAQSVSPMPCPLIHSHRTESERGTRTWGRRITESRYCAPQRSGEAACVRTEENSPRRVANPIATIFVQPDWTSTAKTPGRRVSSRGTTSALARGSAVMSEPGIPEQAIRQL